MKKQTEALKMAIEALEQACGLTPRDAHFCKAIQACKEALEQPAQEPVALKFPTMLRKMWSGTEVQEWLDKNTHPAPSCEPLTQEKYLELKNNATQWTSSLPMLIHLINKHFGIDDGLDWK